MLLAEHVWHAPTDGREQIPLYTIDDKRWETVLDLAHPPGEETPLLKVVAGGDRVAWWPSGDVSRPNAIVVLDWKAGRRTLLQAQPDSVVTLLTLSADGRYLIWQGGPPDRPTGPNTFQHDPGHLFATDLQTMDTVDVGGGPTPAGLLAITTNTRFAAMAEGPPAHDASVWGTSYDLPAGEVRPIVGDRFRGSDHVTILGDWLVVGERGVTQPGDRHPADVETLYFFKLPR